MSYSYANLNTPRNTTSGISQNVWLAPIQAFATGGIKKPTPSSTPGTEIVVTDTHLFSSKKGFVKFALSPEKNAYNAETIGDKGHTKFSHTIKIFVPGSYAEAHEQIKVFINTPLIAIVKDSNCDENMYYQVGNACMGAWMQGTFMTGTTVEGVKGYEITITAQSDYVSLYAGTITMAMGYANAPATLTFSNITNTNIRANWAAVSGASGYILQRATRPDFSDAGTIYTGTNLNYTSTGLTSGKRYYFRVLATHASLQNSRYNSASAITTVTTQLGVVTNLSATALGPTSALWSVDGPVNATSIQVQVSQTGDFNFSQYDETVVINIWPNQMETITSLIANTTYQWRARAIASGYTPGNWVAGTQFTTTT